MNKISVYSWNVQGDLGRFSIKSEKIILKLKQYALAFDVICLQEVVNKNMVQKFAGENGYTVITSRESEKNDKHFCHNIILSRLPVIENGENIFSNQTNVWPKESVLWITVKMGEKLLRIYNCHLQIFKIGMHERQEQIRNVLKEAQKFIGSVIVCGDMNTTLPRAGVIRTITQLIHKETIQAITSDNKLSDLDERYSFAELVKQYGYSDALPINSATWSLPLLHWQIINLKLDWFLTRDINLVKAKLGEYYSDHRPIIAEVS